MCLCIGSAFIALPMRVAVLGLVKVMQRVLVVFSSAQLRVFEDSMQGSQIVLSYVSWQVCKV